MTLRAALYARVSTEEQLAGYSIDAQTRAYRDLCQQRGWQSVGEYIEEGRLARTEDIRKRPVFQRMLTDAQGSAFDLIVVHKVDRFARSRTVAFASFDQLGKWGIGFVSIQENMDFSAAWGQFALTMLVGLAQLFSDNLSQETKKGKSERKLQGHYNGLLPFGYVRDTEHPVAVIDEQTAGGVRLAFDLAGKGKTSREIAATLNDAGYRTTGNHGHNPWSPHSVQYLLANRFYIGELPGGQRGKHPALVTVDDFERVQAALADRAHHRGPSSAPGGARTYSITGLGVCRRCGSRLHAWMDHDQTVRVHCSDRRRGGNCDQGGLRLDWIESWIESWLARIVVSDAQVEAVLRGLAATAATPDETERQRRTLNGRLSRLKRLYLLGDIEEQDYLTQRNEIRTKLVNLPPSPEKRRLDLTRLAALLRSAPLTWQTADGKGKNDLLQGLVEKVIVSDEHVGIVPRADVGRLVDIRNVVDGSSSADNVPDGGQPFQHRNHTRQALTRIAETARETSISEAARRHGVCRQTVRRALGLFGSVR